MGLNILLERPKDKVVLLITLIAIAFFIIIPLAFMQSIEQALMAQSGYGVLDLEFAWTPEQIETIFSAWGAEGRGLEALAVWWDFGFIPSYGFFIFGAVLLVARRLNGKARDFGPIMSLTPLIAGGFDVIENISLLLMLNSGGPINATIPFIASLCATIKFSILIIGIIYFFVGLLLLLIKTIKK